VLAGKLLIYKRESGCTTIGQCASGDFIFTPLTEEALYNKVTAIK
jgi:hypothetical protein